MKPAVVFAGAAAFGCFAAAGAQAREAHCAIYQSGAIVFDGPCNFAPDGRDGSFTLSSLRPGGTLLSEVTTISVAMIAPGVAQVRGLTKGGVNSRWGDARRSTQDRACWIGSDFRVCAR